MCDMDAIETTSFEQLETVTDRLSIVTGGVDRSDFERYGQALGEDLGSHIGLQRVGREAGRDLGGLLWDNRRTPTVRGAVGAGVGGPARRGLWGGVWGGLFGFGLGRSG